MNNNQIFHLFEVGRSLRGLSCSVDRNKGVIGKGIPTWRSLWGFRFNPFWITLVLFLNAFFARGSHSGTYPAHAAYVPRRDGRLQGRTNSVVSGRALRRRQKRQTRDLRQRTLSSRRRTTSFWALSRCNRSAYRWCGGDHWRHAVTGRRSIHLKSRCLKWTNVYIYIYGSFIPLLLKWWR